MTEPSASAATAREPAPFRLTALAHGGGCGCKIGPALLREMLSDACFGFQHPDLLVGATTSDDAAVYRINEHQAVIATTDFFMPIVDDPFEFGRISATNALSDVYAMGGTPILALAIVGMPVGKMPAEVMRRIMEGGADVCRAAGIPLAGGHSIDSPEPIYGLAAIGLVEPARIKRNDGAQPGDVLVLGKPLGIGVLSAALKKGILDDHGYAQMVGVTTQLNRVGRTLAALPGVHAMTDVTGFGLAGHLAEICRGSGVGADVEFGALPVLESAQPLLERGIGPGAIERNWASCSSEIEIDGALPSWAWRLLCDPQTSGGLLVSCAPTAADAVLAAFAAEGFAAATRVGSVRAGADNPRIRVA
jgi:selenide,water dikinase